MSIQRAVRRRLLRGSPRVDLLRAWPLELCDVGGGLELGLPLDGLLDEALRSAREGRVLELVLPFEDAAIDAALTRARLSFWLEETEHGFHYLAYVGAGAI
ncbi:MAG TPA: hypothetical protein VFA20_35350 [Myxococcaceae bacterium]|nr:hypothetical protein [Myxococcaceae bacterium]